MFESIGSKLLLTVKANLVERQKDQGHREGSESTTLQHLRAHRLKLISQAEHS